MLPGHGGHELCVPATRYRDAGGMIVIGGKIRSWNFTPPEPSRDHLSGTTYKAKGPDKFKAPTVMFIAFPFSVNEIPCLVTGQIRSCINLACKKLICEEN